MRVLMQIDKFELNLYSFFKLVAPHNIVRTFNQLSIFNPVPAYEERSKSSDPGAIPM